MQSDIVQRLQPILRRNGWGNVQEYSRHIPFMLEREGLCIVETAEIARLTEALRAAEEEKKALREAVHRLRNGYADAVSGYSYILTQHGRLEGVGFDRVMDHYHDWVAMPEREGLLAGSHTLAGAKP